MTDEVSLFINEFLNYFERHEDDVIEKQNYTSAVLNILGGFDVTKDLISHTETETRLVVDASPEILQGLKDGSINLLKDKKGNLHAQVMKDGKFSDKLPIKEEELVKQGVESSQMIRQLQLQTIQAELKNISDTLKDIQSHLEEISLEFDDDRASHLDIGLDLYLLAKETEDTGLRKELIVQAMRELTTAKAQLRRSIDSDIRYLVDKKYLTKKKSKLAEIDKRLNSIQKNFAVVHKSLLMTAAIFYEQNEVKAFTKVLEVYAEFISTSIEPYSKQLAELDENEELILGSSWERRVKSLESINKIKIQISGNTQSKDKELES